MKTYKVKPINSVEEVKSKYDYVYDWITDKTIPLKKLTEEKELCLVPVDKTIPKGGEEAFLKEKGYQSVPPNYLLGLNDQYPDAIEKCQDCVATSELFADERGYRCFLDAYRRDGGRRLDLVLLEGGWNAGHGWVFLAESLKNSPSESSDPKTLGRFINELKELIANYDV